MPGGGMVLREVGGQSIQLGSAPIGRTDKADLYTRRPEQSDRGGGTGTHSTFWSPSCDRLSVSCHSSAPAVSALWLSRLAEISEAAGVSPFA